MRRHLSTKDGLKLIGLTTDSLRSLLDWEKTLSTTARKGISNAVRDLTKCLALLSTEKSHSKMASQSSRSLNVRISGAIWTCLELFLSGIDYKTRPVWHRYLVPLSFPDMDVFAKALEGKFEEGMNWNNRRSAWFLSRTHYPDRTYTTVNDSNCQETWDWTTLIPENPEACKARARRTRDDQSPTLPSVPEEDMSHLTQQPSAGSY